ncbi:MAG: hypothetical protein FWG47_00295 [Propionibacteriaceae bacterium]|nr:hypothetical protein [Propionibacteriaceae bacterium]
MKPIKHKWLALPLIALVTLSPLTGCSPQIPPAAPGQSSGTSASPDVTVVATPTATTPAPSGKDWGELTLYVDAGAAITFKAPASWVQQLFDVQGGISVMRLHAADGEPNDRISAQLELTFWPENEGSFAEQMKNLERYYLDLTELPAQTVDKRQWQRLQATQRKDGEGGSNFVMNGYYSRFRERNLYIQIENIPETDPLIEQILDSFFQI